jgi:hypothetical protein
MPIDDPTNDGMKPKSLHARLTVEPQPAWSASRSEAVDDGMPLALGTGSKSIGRSVIRKKMYHRSQRFRSERNRCPVKEF